MSKNIQIPMSTMCKKTTNMLFKKQIYQKIMYKRFNSMFKTNVKHLFP